MFEQVIANGANLFIIIVALLIGFMNALAYIDMKKVNKEQEEKGQGN